MKNHAPIRAATAKLAAPTPIPAAAPLDSKPDPVEVFVGVADV